MKKCALQGMQINYHMNLQSVQKDNSRSGRVGVGCKVLLYSSRYHSLRRG
nr:MAG TPA: hypothetical protein [Caudoviricetes sp.]